MEHDACAGQTVSSPPIGARPTAAPIGSTAAGECVDEFEDGKGVLVGARRRLSRRRRGNPRAARRPAAAARRHDRLEPRLDRGALRRAARRASTTSRAALVWAGEREAIVPGVSYRRRAAAPTSCAARRCSCSARVAAGHGPAATACVCHPGTHNKWASVAGGRIDELPHGDDRRAVQPAARSTASSPTCCRAMPSRTRRSPRRAPRPRRMTISRPSCSRSARACCSARRRREDAASYTSGLLIGADVRIGLAAQPTGASRRDGPARADRALRRGASARPGASAIELDGEQCFLAGIRQIAERIGMSAIGLAHRYLEPMPAGRDHPRRDARTRPRRSARRSVEAGIRIIEVPLNSPDPLKSIERLVGAGSATARWSAPARCSIRPRSADVRAAGGRIIVSPNTNADVIARDRRRGPGFAAPAISRRPRRSPRSQAGATALKLFPAEAATPAVLKAQRAVLPKDVPVIVVGGVKPDNMRPWLDAGAAGFGLGGGLYQPGQSAEDTLTKARAYVAGCRRDEADPDRDHRLRQDRRRPACAGDRGQSAVRAGRDVEPVRPGRRASLHRLARADPHGRRPRGGRDHHAAGPALRDRPRVHRTPASTACWKSRRPATLREIARPRLPRRRLQAFRCSPPGMRSTRRRSMPPPRRSPASASRSMDIIWHEDVHKWHPGQRWIWEPGGFGVFDPGINAFSIATKIFPGSLFVESADLQRSPRTRKRRSPPRSSSPARRRTARCAASLDWRRTEGEEWTIAVETARRPRGAARERRQPADRQRRSVDGRRARRISRHLPPVRRPDRRAPQHVDVAPLPPGRRLPAGRRPHSVEPVAG